MNVLQLGSTSLVSKIDLFRDLGFSTHDASECGDAEDGTRGTLPRSHSERLLAIHKEQVNQEKEIKEKYYDAIFSTVEKLMRNSQSNQLKMLGVLLERETTDVMRELQATRRDEVKKLSKIHKDKDEMVGAHKRSPAMQSCICKSLS